MTLDGFIARQNGEMDWMINNWDDGLNTYVKELTEPVDCIILGRKLAQGFIPYWASNPEGEDALGVDKMNSTSKIVFTKTLEKSDWDNTVLAKGDLTEEITKLKKQEGQDIIVYGGATFVSDLIKHNLIDEYYLFINPVAIGKGMTIFNDIYDSLQLTFVKSSSFECGIVVLQYKSKHL